MFIFNIDRGGTFTDFYVQKVTEQKIVQQHCFKVPSSSSQGQGPIVGIKQFLSTRSDYKITEKIPTKLIKFINIGTTIATNALLERKGCDSVVIVSEGFEDILHIRNQARPNIFDLKCAKPSPLTKHTLPIDSRLYLHPIPTIPNLQPLSPTLYHQPPSPQSLSTLLSTLSTLSPTSIGISLCNSYLSPHAQNELLNSIKQSNLPNINFDNIQKGSNYVELGYLKRTETVSLDCYLNPIMKEYFGNFLGEFQDVGELKVRVMKSSGGFGEIGSVRASDLLLSGPAGGLIGYSKCPPQLQKLFSLSATNLLGLDMGGTSTDISKVQNGQIELKYTFEAEGIEICTPHLEIDTIAAGGGSKLGWENGMLTVGPESVGSRPGPVCYGIGDELAITDANMVLNRLDPEFFPKIFGKTHDQPPNKQLSLAAFQSLTQKITSTTTSPQKKSLYQLAEGYIQIANELMAKSARKILTLGKPDALIVFGSAGGQHCCDIADKIGIGDVVVGRFSGILSAYGLSLASQVEEERVYLGVEVEQAEFDFQGLRKIILEKRNHKQPQPSTKNLQITQQVTIAYSNTTYSLKLPLTPSLLSLFQQKHHKQNGFTLPTKSYKIQYYIRSTIKKPQSYQSDWDIGQEQDLGEFYMGMGEVFLGGKWRGIGRYRLEGMRRCFVEGPAVVFSGTSSVLVQDNWDARIINENIHLKRRQKVMKQQPTQSQSQSFTTTPTTTTPNTTNTTVNIINITENTTTTTTTTTTNTIDTPYNYSQCDPIKLTIYSTRLMGIAEQMGKILQKTSISTNIKQRLDFSCGIFDWNGHLLANAPHLPVHLGSMETAVVEQIRRGIRPGDVVLSNHPIAGGSHLPDLTVVSCFQIVEGLNFYVASRGHHADIGGITPGSMPPFSRHLSQQGVAIQKFQLIENSTFLQAQTRSLFSQSRRIDDNISDLLAQISANEFGIKLLKLLISEYGVHQFKKYIYYVCQNAKESVQDMLCRFSEARMFPEVCSVENREVMDDGTQLCLKLIIDRGKREAVFDFGGTGPEVVGNTNAPRSITRSAVLYCLRSLLGKQIPLNSGCLIPIKLIIPQNSILSPSPNAAVVGGNVQTSQKLVDLILKPFNHVACSQGTMNNFLFGNKKTTYYQTICGGSGAGQGFNGTTTQCHMTNTRITDMEHLERYYPVVLVQFRKRGGSGGQGLFRGGDGVVREVMFLEEMEVSVLSQRRIFSPYGLEGGENGKTGKNLLITHDGIVKNIGSKNCFKVSKYDRVQIQTPGGGGYGKKL